MYLAAHDYSLNQQDEKARQFYFWKNKQRLCRGGGFRNSFFNMWFLPARDCYSLRWCWCYDLNYKARQGSLTRRITLLCCCTEALSLPTMSKNNPFWWESIHNLSKRLDACTPVPPSKHLLSLQELKASLSTSRRPVGVLLESSPVTCFRYCNSQVPLCVIFTEFASYLHSAQSFEKVMLRSRGCKPIILLWRARLSYFTR